MSEDNFKLVNWLKGECLPFWEKYGIDYDLGGFYELLKIDKSFIDKPRRSRLIARQIFSFSKGRELGWNRDINQILSHGMQFLENFLISNSGQVFQSIHIKTNKINKSHDLYDYAFIIFAMSEMYCSDNFKERALEISLNCIKYLNKFWKHHQIGFLEDPKLSNNLKANPHMHMLEASLAWEEKFKNSSCKNWQELSDEIIELAINKLINRKRNILFELFDKNWEVSSIPNEQYIEPGHQYEWAGLILKWSKLRNNNKYVPIAKELINNAEIYGYDKIRNVCINRLDFNLTSIDRQAKLWPQAERLKAFLILEDFESDKVYIGKKVKESINTINSYLNNNQKKIWEESMSEDGSFSDEPTKASSLYHLITAIAYLNEYIIKNKGLFK